ncbi:DUF2538 family protein [Paenibacillus sp. HB172176]|uniref:DUF2538 family protein n=1 Tax=Paenibacillus sp. HB172176 TaxID=2493690 RepID=UPI001439E501|nr:DUF2538 family protein [Paenibacillus sp. HB172176]
MKAFGLQLKALYFKDDAHRQNYMKLFKRFPYCNAEYASASYIAAIPEIFKCFSLRFQKDGPFDWYLERLNQFEDCSQPIDAKVEALTGQTEAMVHLAINLWNKSDGLNLTYGLSIWDDKLYHAALQAIQIRREFMSLNNLYTAIQYNE